MNGKFLLAIVVVGFLGYIAFLVLRGRMNRSNVPSCFQSDPGPQARAENDCDSCQWQFACFNHRRVCDHCGTDWWSNDGKCHLCRRGEMTQGRAL